MAHCIFCEKVIHVVHNAGTKGKGRRDPCIVKFVLRCTCVLKKIDF